jgi:hypothetical protein
VQRETERLKFVTERAGGGKEKERVAVREEKPEVNVNLSLIFKTPGFFSGGK